MNRAELISRKITDLESAKTWLRDLVELNLSFHLEDDAATIGNSTNGAWVNTFTAREAAQLNHRQDELYGLKWPADVECPIGFMMKCEEEKAARPPVIVRSFSPCGPCLTLGRLTKETAQFYCYEEWRGGDHYEAKKVAKKTPARYSRAHVEPCPSCRDHANTQYPNGYED